MIELGKINIGEHEIETFNILSEGWTCKGTVSMACRVSDMKSEGEAIFIDVSDTRDNKERTYAPVEMDKTELREYIEFLNRCYNKFPK
jgi:hypothetical protein